MRNFIVKMLFCVLLVGVILPLSDAEAAWKPKKANDYSGTKIKVLKPSRQKKIAASVVSKVLKDPFFKNTELAKKVTLSNLSVNGQGIGLGDVAYTDLVLNLLIVERPIIIVNQAIKMDLTMNFKLMHYSDGIKLRQRGILLGANYYLDGDFVSTIHEDEKGKIIQSYRATLILKDIRTGEQIINKETVYNRKTSYKTRFRKER